MLQSCPQLPFYGSHRSFLHKKEQGNEIQMGLNLCLAQLWISDQSANTVQFYLQLVAKDFPSYQSFLCFLVTLLNMSPSSRFMGCFVLSHNFGFSVCSTFLFFFYTEHQFSSQFVTYFVQYEKECSWFNFLCQAGFGSLCFPTAGNVASHPVLIL